MTELKTLKDLKFVNNPNPICKTIKEELKKEAIKWVKEDVNNTSIRESEAYKIIRKWMERLNITEDDLK
ncbi:hypothetical protein LCGC14_0476790 [marine sediment metagenome]|uniref:Uncharacterized protein n=1 Tax=marine sediment metagenome TaxID=412755 RepID=A0A0F9UXP4_9ZZZZ